ncbi:fatty acid desaturase [Massilia sp. BJB1822]|uniref:DesA family fatty acid desaturase n=1 Tax=Massilia sp. BJB1822 TaxID=2744470 RepID=UPI00159307A2|nr:fatty acid desaturase [Massilia sp. BJB1822]NVD97666.1 fatty acid desaturase [Massilia sp. BJB1822]
MATQLQWLAQGVLAFSWWQLLLVGLGTTHATIVSVTVYLHRCQTHRALSLSPVAAHLFRFWLWLSTGMVTREWVAVHRCHHAHCETAKDPHSPRVVGIREVLWRGAELYREATRRPMLVERYGAGAPDDWLERWIYGRYTWQGVGLLLLLELILFGARGLTLWACQMMWIPFLAAGVINGLGHYAGYRNYDCKEAATNIFPIGLLIGGEELHNNHHAFPTSAKFSSRWFELDVGWGYIRVLQWLRLALVRRAPHPLTPHPGQVAPTLATLRQVLGNRAELMRELTVATLSVYRAEHTALRKHLPRPSLAHARRLLQRAPCHLSGVQRSELAQVMAYSWPLNEMQSARRMLEPLWHRSTASQEQLLACLQAWCLHAERFGPIPLRRFARQLASYG